MDVKIEESETFTILDLKGHLHPAEDTDNVDTITAENQAYTELLESKEGNDKYQDRPMQTIQNEPKFKEIQTDTIITKETSATGWFFNHLNFFKNRKLNFQDE